MSEVLPPIDPKFKKENLTKVINDEFDGDTKLEKDFTDLVTDVTTTASSVTTVTAATRPTGQAPSTTRKRSGVIFVEKKSSPSSEADSTPGSGSAVSSITANSANSDTIEKFEDYVKYLMVLMLTKSQLNFNLDTYEQKIYKDSPSLLRNCGSKNDWKNDDTKETCLELLNELNKIITYINEEYRQYINVTKGDKYVKFFENAKILIKTIENQN